MSKDIWHTADITPDPYRSFVINTDKRNIYTGIITNPTEWNPMILPEFYGIGDIDKAERAIRYAYLDDLLALETENKDLSDKIGKLETELDRTRKALEIAVKGLKHMRGTCLSYAADYMDAADNILEQITALEQKDKCASLTHFCNMLKKYRKFNRLEQKDVK